MRKNDFTILLLFIYFLPLILLIGCTIDNACVDDSEESEYIKNTDWTMMHYCSGDSNGLAWELCKDIEEVINGYKGYCNVLVFIDVDDSKEYSIKGERFSGTCIFRVEKNKLTRINLQDVYRNSESSVNSANTTVLRAFISYCKKNYPAKYYGMFLGGHGGGVSSTIYSNSVFRNILYDGDTRQWICTVDLANDLGESCSVDFLGLDLCYMGNVEFLYQIRKGNGGFSADYVTASAPEVWGEGLNYSYIHENFTHGIIPQELACLVVQCQNEYTQNSSGSQAFKQSLVAYDLSKIDNLKQKFDALCNVMTDKKAVAERVRGEPGKISQSNITHYFLSNYSNFWKQYPYFDLYDFVWQLGEAEESLKSAAADVCEAIDELILDSFGRSFYSRFEPGKMGLSIFYPDFSISGCTWDYMMWNQISSSGNECYGKLSWCIDNAQIGNWFTLLESWYKK